jgi:hypothetical protein
LGFPGAWVQGEEGSYLTIGPKLYLRGRQEGVGRAGREAVVDVTVEGVAGWVEVVRWDKKG